MCGVGISNKRSRLRNLKELYEVQNKEIQYETKCVGISNKRRIRIRNLKEIYEVKKIKKYSMKLKV